MCWSQIWVDSWLARARAASLTRAIAPTTRPVAQIAPPRPSEASKCLGRMVQLRRDRPRQEWRGGDQNVRVPPVRGFGDRDRGQKRPYPAPPASAYSSKTGLPEFAEPTMFDQFGRINSK